MSNYSSILYKADQRVSFVSGGSTHFSSLQQPFGNLVQLDDVYLPGGELEKYTSEGVHRILLPITGALSYQDSGSKNSYLTSEQVLYTGNEKENRFIKNPYENGTINYLNIGLRNSKTHTTQPISYPVTLKEFNKLSTLHLNKINGDYYAGIAVYQGRTKGRYTLKNPGNGIFAYVINGAFELEERLMEHRDGLGLWNLKHIEFESLSEFAILLLLEIPFNT